MTEYHLILCDVSGEHRPIARSVSGTPFHTVHVGERFDDIGWGRLDGGGVLATPENPIRYTVHSIKHLVQETENGLMVSYGLNLQPYEGPASPAWPDDISGTRRAK